MRQNEKPNIIIYDACRKLERARIKKYIKALLHSTDKDRSFIKSLPKKRRHQVYRDLKEQIICGSDPVVETEEQ